ncbi:fibrinogen C domain-containing protein 1-like isoform X2 [Toxorhynchites rutilus septentrionalis]|uniref:fibrinogen C domain-containing protein 1-like isoform X2 n=1 Tax=Toxorhynchites rutilus septentrionalis TaxID=329112 RepID=UPI00247B1DB5|nr:fibrinogen C domain-containing protein 1-like isoform X2 [Toxorhynchites rutilus septentrionalis]XP_055632673.1 fibrinogen C domain-containing protein 1-like isoform X2 [Toxorhynchites rutilus septentrionalis]XP_055632674.1 fibrinogen C domain-containing protein 1-like isoform X2 [Toxorhynchites rutilus septentrionalis]
MARVFWIKCIIFCTILTCRRSLTFANDDVVPSGFGYELLITKMELLEHKVSTLEAIVADLKAQQVRLVENINSLKASCPEGSMDTTGGYKSCSDAPTKIPGVVSLNPPRGPPFDALCDFHNHGGGWTIIQHRFSGEEDFYRTWEEYKRGFGKLTGEFWLGLEKIYRITNSGDFELMFILTDRDLNLVYAKYSLFRIGSEDEGYLITRLGNYSGTAGDSFSYHSGMKFTTWDRKNDKIPGSNNNCAVTFHGAWWYNNCQTSNLNGRYRGDGESTCWNTYNPPKFAWCNGFNSILIMIRETN